MTIQPMKRLPLIALMLGLCLTACGKKADEAKAKAEEPRRRRGRRVVAASEAAKAAGEAAHDAATEAAGQAEGGRKGCAEEGRRGGEKASEAAEQAVQPIAVPIHAEPVPGTPPTEPRNDYACHAHPQGHSPGRDGPFCRALAACCRRTVHCRTTPCMGTRTRSANTTT